MSTPILFRANANSAIGTGHVMRCLALAQAWRRHGGVIHFLLSAGMTGLESRLQAAGCTVSHLPPHVALGSAEDAAMTIEKAKGLPADWVVVDGYDFDAAFQARLKEANLRLLFIDDYGHCDYYLADLILNQNSYARGALYANRATDTEVLLGCDFALLREEFRPWIGWKREIKPVAEKLLITLGGADPENQTGKIVEALRLVQTPLHVTVLVGAANPYQAQLAELVAELRPFHTIQLVRNATDMPQLMAAADVAVSAGGSTSLEMAFMGLPGLALIIADNQREVVKHLAGHGVVVDLGWHQTAHTAQIAARLQATLDDPAQRHAMQKNGRLQVDGWGAERVVAKMMRRILLPGPSELSLRPALPEDMELYWKWANDPSVRRNAFNADPIPWEDHVAWFTGKITNDDCRLWLLLDAGTPIGQIRYDLQSDKAAEIGFSIAAEQRGKGAGTQLLRHTRHLAAAALAAEKLVGLVFSQNSASQIAFARAGYQTTGDLFVKNGQQYLRFIWQRGESDETF